MTGVVVLVDGHNLIHGDPELRTLTREIEAARRALEALLSGRPSVIVFYDGGPGGEARTTIRGGLRIEYSGTGEADDRILTWLKERPVLRTMVVTDDRALAAQARALGARIVAGKSFLRGVRSQPPSDPKPDGVPDQAEVELWLRLFGENP
jgi:predicted RNA-binding protein with PIN domain